MFLFLLLLCVCNPIYFLLFHRVRKHLCSLSHTAVWSTMATTSTAWEMQTENISHRKTQSGLRSTASIIRSFAETSLTWRIQTRNARHNTDLSFLHARVCVTSPPWTNNVWCELCNRLDLDSGVLLLDLWPPATKCSWSPASRLVGSACLRKHTHSLSGKHTSQLSLCPRDNRSVKSHVGWKKASRTRAGVSLDSITVFTEHHATHTLTHSLTHTHSHTVMWVIIT